jgi:hypothetical protein
MSRSTDDDLDFMEGKRLRRLGIDPDGNPVEIVRKVDRRLAELREATSRDRSAVPASSPQSRVPPESA